MRGAGFKFIVQSAVYIVQFALFLVQTAPKVHYGHSAVCTMNGAVCTRSGIWHFATLFLIFPQNVKLFFKEMSYMFLKEKVGKLVCSKRHTVSRTSRSISKYTRKTIPTAVALRSHTVSQACPKQSTNRMRF